MIEGPANGGRKGCIVFGDWVNFSVILKRAGLDYRLNPHTYLPVFTVGRPEDLIQYEEELRLSGLRGENRYAEIIGRFLGYPECCIREYVAPITLELDGWKSRFHKELDKLRREGKDRPPELYYAPAQFIPCGVYCPSAIKILGIWGEMMEKYDPVAAEELRRLNSRCNFPGSGRVGFKVSDLPSLYIK